MKKIFLIIFLCVITFACYHPYKPYIYDNGNDYISDGTSRIIDSSGKIGYVDSFGKVIIKPQYAFGYPFKNGKAKVTYKGYNKTVKNSNGEYHKWVSGEWFYIDKKGNKIK